MKILKGRDHLGYLGIGETVILKRVLSQNSQWLWNRFIWLRIAVSGGLLKYDNEPSSP
jgi:hypothetical protein